MASRFYAPDVLAIGSSRRGEPSWSGELDPEIGLSGARHRTRGRGPPPAQSRAWERDRAAGAVIDRFTKATLDWLERHVFLGARAGAAARGASLAQLFASYDPARHPGPGTAAAHAGG